jgi:hypothetical protein
VEKHTDHDDHILEQTEKSLIKRQLLISAAIFLFLLIGTVLVVLYGRGNRLIFDDGRPEVVKTGILAAKSLPEGAQVFVDNHLVAATDENLNLAPGEYTVKIFKDGYFPWEKKVIIEEEVVTRAEALLIPTTPRLENITTTGAGAPVIDPSGTKLAYTVASQSARKNGVYVFDMNATTILSFQSAIKQIADDSISDLSTSELAWAPDGEQLLASLSATISDLPTTYLLTANQLNAEPQDVTLTLETLKNTWMIEKNERERARLAGLKAPLRTSATQYFTILSWAPDDTKFLYVAKSSGELPLIIKPRLVGINTMREVRTITQGSVYVYDVKEDVNIKLLDSLPNNCIELFSSCPAPLTWHPDSNHLIYVKDRKIQIMEYDGTNNTTVYAGPFLDSYVFPWPNGSKLVILTNFNNPDIQPNLYTISLR